MNDQRVYLARHDFTAAVKEDGPPVNCHRAAEGEEHYHRITTGEVYFTDGPTDFCLNCALLQGIITRERPSLEKGSRVPLNG
jgi:hypothetical protein